VRGDRRATALGDRRFFLKTLAKKSKRTKGTKKTTLMARAELPGNGQEEIVILTRGIGSPPNLLRRKSRFKSKKKKKGVLGGVGKR